MVAQDLAGALSALLDEMDRLAGILTQLIENAHDGDRDAARTAALALTAKTTAIARDSALLVTRLESHPANRKRPEELH